MNAIDGNINAATSFKFYEERLSCLAFTLTQFMHGCVTYAVIPRALVVHLIYTPSAFRPVALRLWVYIYIYIYICMYILGKPLAPMVCAWYNY